MSPKDQIGDLLDELHKLKNYIQTGDGLLIYAEVQLRIYELRKTLEERKDYSDQNNHS